MLEELLVERNMVLILTIIGIAVTLLIFGIIHFRKITKENDYML